MFTRICPARIVKHWRNYCMCMGGRGASLGCTFTACRFSGAACGFSRDCGEYVCGSQAGSSKHDTTAGDFDYAVFSGHGNCVVRLQPQ